MRRTFQSAGHAELEFRGTSRQECLLYKVSDRSSFEWRPLKITITMKRIFMGLMPHICVVIPVYNHALTVARVAREAQPFFQIIAVDDGSTDESASRLSHEAGIFVVRLAHNQGKGAALRAGFAEAEQRGFTHAITMDADGQHSAEDLASFGDLCRRQPEAIVIGSRDLKRAGAPRLRRWLNTASSWCFFYETGLYLSDTQCGYRCYPLSRLRCLTINSGRYAFELEVIVKAAWLGVPLLACPITVDYSAPTSRLSHFRPCADLAHITRVHFRLLRQRLLVRLRP